MYTGSNIEKLQSDEVNDEKETEQIPLERLWGWWGQYESWFLKQREKITHLHFPKPENLSKAEKKKLINCSRPQKKYSSRLSSWKFIGSSTFHTRPNCVKRKNFSWNLCLTISKFTSNACLSGIRSLCIKTDLFQFLLTFPSPKWNPWCEAKT